MSGHERPRIVVVGGGLAGLAAGIAAADGGASVRVMEAKKWLGGATASFERDGLVIDTGQHVFLRCCTAYRSFLDRLGVADRTHVQPRMDIPVLSPNRRPARLRRGRLPAPLHLASALATYPFLAMREKVAVARAALRLRTMDATDPSLDSQSFGSWLAANHQSDGAVRYLWNLFALPTLNVSADRASLSLALKVFRTGLLERSDAADIGVPLVPLSRLHAEPASRALAAAGAEIHLGARVRRVLTDEDGVAGVALDDGAVDADAVIVAVPSERVSSLLPPGTFGDARDPSRLGSSPIVNVHVVYDRTVTPLPFAAAVDSPVQWVFDRTEPAGLRDGQYLAISLSGADDVMDRPVEWFRQTFVPALEELFPPARSARVKKFLVTREPSATFRQEPGTAALRAGTITNVPGVFMAGAWTDTSWPATMEGAVRSGVAAAREALVTLGRTDRLPAEVAA
ncbi:MAG: hydroxysqualene dehydroxylase HpnE [Actinomycetota bacterium]|nr:hydroxysqualene dehydroxylase HpnE [Actinomycetota bacterium]